MSFVKHWCQFLWILNFDFANINIKIPVMSSCSGIALQGSRTHPLMSERSAASGDWEERKIEKWDRISKTLGNVVSMEEGEKKILLPSWTLHQWSYEYYIHIEREPKRKEEHLEERGNRTSKETARKITSLQKMLQFQWLNVQNIHTPFPTAVSTSFLGALYVPTTRDGCGTSSRAAKSSWWHVKESRRWMTTSWRLSTGPPEFHEPELLGIWLEPVALGLLPVNEVKSSF